MTSDPAAYLTEALDYIERHALRSNTVDWPVVRAEALARIQDAQMSADTYPALRWVLSCLGDHHSFLLSPQSMQRSQTGSVTSVGLLAVYPEGVIVAVHEQSPAAQAGLLMRDTIATINGTPRAQLDHITFNRALHTSPLSLTFRRTGQESLVNVILEVASYTREIKPQGWQLEPTIGYLELPGVTGNSEILKTYAQTAQHLIQDMDQAGVRQWVIDLRRNTGGNMWVMLVGLQSIVGDGECGFFLSPSGKQTSWLPALEKQTTALLSEPYRLNHSPDAIAILTSRLTCSAGEFTALAFRGRPHARSFGEPTTGLPTGNHGKQLCDGAVLFLTVSYGADRTGQVYEGPIIPDQVVTSDWTLFQTECDPVVLAAVDWLRSHGTA